MRMNIKIMKARASSSFHLITLLVFVSGLAATPLAYANERHLTYTYETAVLPRGAKEIEIWTTPRLGRDDYYARFDERLEFEVGVTDRLQTSLYLNWNAITSEAEVMPGFKQKVSATEFEGISSEWKYKLIDPVANAVGFALYGEASLGPTESELEGKLIFDKRIGKLLLAANLVAAVEFEFEGAEPEAEEIEIEPVLGATYFITPNLALGLELRNHNKIAKEPMAGGEFEWEHSALFLGPVVSYATQSWWVAATILPQLPALKKEGAGSRVLDEHEELNARVIFAFHLD